MHPFFQPLTDFEACLLLVTQHLGSPEGHDVFSFLSPDVSHRLKEKADAIAALSSEKRSALVVKEFKDMILQDGQRGIERVDPSWIVHAMEGESPRMVAALMVLFPPAVARSVYKRLPEAIQQELPRKEAVASLLPALLKNLRLVFDHRFVPMPALEHGSFHFVDLIHLERQELYVLCRDLGLAELGQSFAVIGKGALMELCRRLPRECAQELVEAVSTSSKVGLPNTEIAEYFLGRVVENFQDPEEFFQKAGLWRLAKASMQESSLFCGQFRQRLPVFAGQLFETYVGKAKELPDIPADMHTILQDSILVRLKQMAHREMVGIRWAQIPMAYHDADRASRFEKEQMKSEKDNP